MSGSSFERESRRARKRRRERERQLQAAGAVAAGAPQLAIRDVFAHPEPGLDSTHEPLDDGEACHECASEADDSDAVTTPSSAIARHSGRLTEPPESASAQIAALQDALQEKDRLLTALTAQLEEAANRLDRLHRAGADRAPRMSSAAADAAPVSMEVADQLSRLCGDWEDLRLGDQFEVLRGKLDDIYDAIAALPEGLANGLRPAEAAAERSETPSSTKLPGWEDMKAQLLRNGADYNRSAERAQSEPAAADSAADVLNELTLEPPLAVDLETADRDALATAVEERDIFISHLIRRLRSGPSGRYEAINWAALADAPQDLRERLQELEARLQELLRMEECDMSLERARLARERARLEQMRRDVERETRGGFNTPQPEDDADRSERRWLRVFSFGRKGDESENGD